MDKSWMSLTDRVRSPAYAEGVNQFLTTARSHAVGRDRIRCPCRICCNNLFRPIPEVESHLFINGIDSTYTQWIYHGEEETQCCNEEDNQLEHSHDDDYIDDMDHMLDDVWAGALFDEEQDSTPLRTNPSIPEDISLSSFSQLLDDARQPLFPGCTKFSKLSFVVKLLHIKTIGHWSIKSFNMLLTLLRSAFPDALLPQSYEESRSLERGLGFKYEKIHACPNDCILFWKDNAEKNECPKCGASRWISSTHGTRVIPIKVLRHFPLIPRLQRLYVSAQIASDMRWHKEKRVADETSLRHPSDSESWKKLDTDHSWFAEDARNVRLGLASDGFNPFNNMAKPYSIWPVILVPYNLPPWLCMKDQFFMTSLIIPGPKSPENDIDVYLQPLIDELVELWEHGVPTYDASTSETFVLHAALLWTINDLQPLIDELVELWEHGVPTYDASTSETFVLHAALLWTINDFPAYGNLSGWSTKGKLACPSCNAGTEAIWLKYGRKHSYMGHRRFLPPDHIWRSRKHLFNGQEDHRVGPPSLVGSDILSQLDMLGIVQFGKTHRKRKRTVDELNWTKTSIFFNLPYWETLMLRHNLDVMHIEKNISDNILGTLMNIAGKSKDNVNARRDLEIIGIRKELHLKRDGDRLTMPNALYTLHGEERHKFCEWLSEVKFPDGFAANIDRCVSVRDCKISGLKSHDNHVFLQRLLPIAVGGFLRKDIALALTELSSFFKELVARTLDKNRLLQLEMDIVIILCKLEMYFPPSFFDVMVHLAVHLPREAIMAGPVQYRWMYPFERYLGKYKRYVKNKARPEGSIAEASIHLECLTFCSLYLEDVQTKFNRADRNIDGFEGVTTDGFSIFNQKVHPLGVASKVALDPKLLRSASWYVLHNCTEIGSYLQEHCELCQQLNPNIADRTHQRDFETWFKQRVKGQRTINPLDVSEDLYALACGPETWVSSYSGCIINGKRFHTKQREVQRVAQNSGVFVTGDNQTNNVDFYGIIHDVVELHYMGWRRVYLFRCSWFDVGDQRRRVRVDDHMTSVNMDKTWYKDEPFVLACQASQYFYIKDLRAKGNWYVVQKFTNRNVYDIPPGRTNLEAVQLGESSDDGAYQDNESSFDYAPAQCPDLHLSTPLSRTDIAPRHIDAREVVGTDRHDSGVADFINDFDVGSGSEVGYGDGEYSDEEEFSSSEEPGSE